MKKKVSSKKSKQGKQVQNSKLTKKTDIDTFDAWLDHQRVHGLGKGTFRSFTEGKMPSDTTQDWLAKQRVSEEATKEVDVTLPASTTEAWLRKQVSDRISVEEKVEAAQEPAQTPEKENSIQALPE
jgi:hypothetical protein